MVSIGSLRYDVIADTSQFQSGMAASRRELSAAKKVFLETRAPVETLGIEIAGLSRLFTKGALTQADFRAALAGVGIETAKTSKELLANATALRAEANAIRDAQLASGKWTTQKQQEIAALNATAIAIERELAARKRLTSHQQFFAAGPDRSYRAGLPTTGAGAAAAGFGLGRMQKPGVSFGMGATIAGLIGLKAAATAATAAMDLESVLIEFEVLTGSLSNATRLVNQLRKLDVQTTLTFPDTTKAAAMLLGYGIEAEKIEPTLRRLGDVSRGNGETFSLLAKAYADVAAKTRLTAEELKQFVNAGFNPLTEMARTSGRDITELQEAMSKREVSFEDVAKAIESATSAGGRYFGMVARSSTTARGQLELLKGEWSQLMVKEGQAIKPLTDWMTEFGRWSMSEAAVSIDTTADRLKHLFNVSGTVRERGLDGIRSRMIEQVKEWELQAEAAATVFDQQRSAENKNRTAQDDYIAQQEKMRRARIAYETGPQLTPERAAEIAAKRALERAKKHAMEPGPMMPAAIAEHRKQQREAKEKEQAKEQAKSLKEAMKADESFNAGTRGSRAEFDTLAKLTASEATKTNQTLQEGLAVWQGMLDKLTVVADDIGLLKVEAV